MSAEKSMQTQRRPNISTEHQGLSATRRPRDVVDRENMKRDPESSKTIPDEHDLAQQRPARAGVKLLPTCMAAGLGAVLVQNAPELKDTISAREWRPCAGAAAYIGTAALGYALGFWALASTFRSLAGMAAPLRKIG